VNLHRSNVLIVSDEAEFAQSAIARWETERRVPAVTLLGSDLWNTANPKEYHLVVLGPVGRGKLLAILQALAHWGTATVCVADDARAISSLHAKSPNVLVVPAGEGSIHTLILVANEVLRRVEAVTRARRAEDEAASLRKQAMLGQYMLELRNNFNDALTSLLGNAELVLMAPGQLSPEAREQVRTVHMMALRLSEMLLRFSSLASEMQAVESQPQGETKTAGMKELTAL
jgi:signal transduction histidine kinase